MNPVLARLLAQRQEQIDFISQTLETVEAGQRDLSDAERSNVEAAQARISQLSEQITPLEAFEEVRNAHAQSASNVAPTAPERPTPAPLGAATRAHQYPSPGAFVVDMLRATGQRISGGQELLPDLDARQRVESALGRSLSAEERAIAHQTTAQTPGILPEPIIGEILTDLDESRPFVTSVGAKPLGTVAGKKFSRPHITQHSQVGKQTAEKAELPSRQVKIDPIEFDKETFGGALNISRQDIDWTDPSAWDAVITDLQLVYGAETEDWAAAQLVAAVTQSETITAANAGKVEAWITAMYAAAAKAGTANGTKRASALRLPDTIWTSVDMWATLGAVLDIAKITAQNPPADSSPTAFAGSILSVPRVVAPGLPAGTFVIGRSSLFEFYEERIGLLSAIEPKVLGIEVAYGGYAAAGALDPSAFTKVTVGTGGGG